MNLIKEVKDLYKNKQTNKIFIINVCIISLTKFGDKETIIQSKLIFYMIFINQILNFKAKFHAKRIEVHNIIIISLI